MISRSFGQLAVVLLALGAAAVVALPAQAAYEDVWPDLKTSVFGVAEIVEEDGIVSLETPVRAEDAALVPITVRMPAATAERVKKLTLVVDKNPVPVAATFSFGKAAGKGDRMLSTRIRINRYTYIRAVVETDDGKLHMTSKFVKATGGCSAPFGKDYETALEGLGKTKIKTFPASNAGLPEAQVMVRHPSFTGMQIDPMTRVTAPARFVEDLEVKTGGETIFRMEGGITISEDPNFRFTYAPGGDGLIEVSGKDTSGAIFGGKSSTDGS
jgi:sulfur-oxidizing protein SoxY